MLALLTVVVASAAAFAEPRPNIVVFFSDDHARRAISAYSREPAVVDTPAIDRIAAEGARFDRHYTANPLCAPSRAALLTGLHSHRNGLRDNRDEFDGSQRTLPKLLREAGYETAVIGKWHLKSDPTGFDHWEVLPGQGSYYQPEFLTPEGTQKNGGYVTDVITDKALAWLRRPHEKPFFLLIGHKAPHRNWVPGPDRFGLFADVEFAEPETMRTDYATLCPAAKTVRMRIDRDLRPGEDLMVEWAPPRLPPDIHGAWREAFAPQDAAYRARLEADGDLLAANYQRYMRNYLRCVAAIDEGVGQVLDVLDASGTARTTVVVYASDQGFFLGENAWFDKRLFYEPSSGTPLIVRAPGVTDAGTVIDRVTSNVDVAPTLLELAGVAPPADMHGRSLVPLLRGDGAGWGARPAYGRFYESNDGEHNAPRYVAACTRDGRYKVVFYHDLGEWELFDLREDAMETRNMWGEPLAAEARASCVRELVEIMVSVGEDPDLIAMVERAAR